ncbi:MAG: DsbC family protein [Burkholderiales bacterium]
MSFRLLVLFLAATLSAAAFADEASVKRAVEARFGNIKVDSVAKTPYFGLYEVVIGEKLIYTDDKVNYIVDGSIVDARTRQDLTEVRMQKLSAIKFEDLPLDSAIKTVRGTGKRVFATFEDPNCPYCKRLWNDMAKLDNVTIYTFLYPILSADSVSKAKAIWCAKDRSRAWVDHMLNGSVQSLAAEECENPIDKNLALGRKLRVTGTPTMFFTNGQRLVGARPEELAKLIGESTK